VAGVPVLSGAGSRADHLAALIASSAELSTFSRNLHHLTKLLRHGEFARPRSTGRCWTPWAPTCASHLLVAGALADLRPRGGTSGRRPICRTLTFRSTVMSQAPNIDGVLISGATGSSIPGNRIVKVPAAAEAQRCWPQPTCRRHPQRIEATVCAARRR
jgi:hypothetical protein